MMGFNYAYIALVKKPEGDFQLVQAICSDAENGGEEEIQASQPCGKGTSFLRIVVGEGALCFFQFSPDGKKYHDIGNSFQATPGKWVGAKVGLFASCGEESENTKFADFEFFSID